MTDLENYCAEALRLSTASASALLSQIQLNIDVARAELIRSGLSIATANDDTNKLVLNCIIKYVVSNMAEIETERVRAHETFRICLDELRKSVNEE